MPMVKVVDIIRRVETVLQDTNLRWPRVELQDWLNEAYLSVVLVRPDASAKAGTFDLAVGTRQVLTSEFPNALRLLDITRNVAAASDKRVIRAVARSVLDDQRPAWHAEPGALNIQHFTYDDRQPKEFFVYPPAASGAAVEVVYADSPQPHQLAEAALDPEGGNTEVIRLDDTYVAPLVDYVLYRAYSKDAEYGANEARASAAYASFMGAIGAKSASDSASKPTPNSVT